MARKGYCASCGREVWLGRDGGCQFGHPASQLSNVHESDPAKPGVPVAAAPAAPSVPRPAPAVPQAPAPASHAAPAAVPADAYAAVPPPPPGPRPFVPPPPLDAPAVAVGSAAVAAAPAPGADPAGAWGNSPDDLLGAPDTTFDYMALSNDTSIGDTDCLTKRAIARIIDNTLLLIVMLVLTVPAFLAAVAAAQNDPGTMPEFSNWPYVVGTLVQFAYFMILPSVWKGRTLGKAVVGIAVTDMHDHAPTIQQLVIRELAMIVDGLFYGIVGLVIASKSPRTQRLGDQWAQTVVVRTR